MHYVITRGHKPGKSLTPSQRTSSLFAEEPVVLGKVLRRGSKPMHITEAQYEANKAKLLRLVEAGSIVITLVAGAGEKKKDAKEETAPDALDLVATAGNEPVTVVPPTEIPALEAAPAVTEPAKVEEAPAVETAPEVPATVPAAPAEVPAVPTETAAPTASETGKKRGKKG
jgi:hypothetical protein